MHKTLAQVKLQKHKKGKIFFFQGQYNKGEIVTSVDA